MESNFSPICRRDELVIQELINEVLIYDLKNDKALCLNETSALVWSLCNGTNSVSKIAKEVSGKINTPVSEDLIWLALDQLRKENLIEESEEIVSRFKGMSRRDMIKKAGLASAIALPVISSLVAPPAALGQSCVAITEPCVPSGTPCCPHYGDPTFCIDQSGNGTSFVCLSVTV